METVMLPIPRKNNAKKYEFRSISLISNTAEIILRLLNRCLYSKVEGKLKKSSWPQEVKRYGRCNWIAMNNLEKHKEVCVAFLDLEAFDRADLIKLMGILRKLGMVWTDRRLLSNLSYPLQHIG